MLRMHTRERDGFALDAQTAAMENLFIVSRFYLIFFNLKKGSTLTIVRSYAYELLLLFCSTHLYAIRIYS